MKRKKLGLAFFDEVNKVTQRSGHFQNRKDLGKDWQENLLPNFQPENLIDSVSPWRLVFVASIMLVAFFGLFLRLFELQIVSGKSNKELADSNRIQIKTLHAPRGVIYDRNGKVLADNNPGYRLNGKFISRDEALELEAKRDPRFNGLELDSVRHYLYKEVLAHVLGYVGQVSAEELQDLGFSKYKMGDLIGRAGIEQRYEEELRGTDGSEIVEVDAQGEKLRTLRKIDPVPGRNVHLAIDIDLQRIAFDALRQAAIKAGSCCGAVVASDPKSGQILALASYPSFDPNTFTDPSKNDQVAVYFNDPKSPLLNRVIAGSYPPGSTFKIASALAGLYSRKINDRTTIEDTGVVNLGPYRFTNWYFTEYGKTEGSVDLVKALQRSNDIFFYRVGELVGEEVLGETAIKIGMGKKLGIDLPGEVDGLIPGDTWKRKNVGQPWYPGDSLHMAIGQGFLLTTPLQILAQTSFVSSDGKLAVPHLVTKITNPQGVIIKQFKFEPLVKDIFKAEDLAVVKKGLEAVPKMGGTAWPFFNFSVPTAGKTGTAEFGHPQNKTHAWYTAYAPVDNPEIAVTALVEAGGEGSTVAAPIVKDIYTWYFNPDKTNVKSLDTFSVATDSARQLGE